MSLNRQGRPTSFELTDPQDKSLEDEISPPTVSGSKGLSQEEPLLFETGRLDVTGVDFEQSDQGDDRLGHFKREESPRLSGLTEPETLRHYVRLSQKNYAIDLGLYPLGSCTMKHNPRLNEKLARLEGFADLHPLQPQKTVQGALELMGQLADWLKVLTGLPSIALSPRAGAHGELCGVMAIYAACQARGETERLKVLVPASAHGTNPATAVQCGFKVEEIPGDATGRVDKTAFLERLGPDVAAVMITNPNTCGLFERDMAEISKAVHEAGGYVYCDGANFNAIMGRVRPGDLGVDAMHFNLHKTFSTPHGGGGPGSGPTVLSEALAPYAPLPRLEKGEDGTWCLIERGRYTEDAPFGRLSAFHGQMGMFVRALAYMLSHGGDGLRQAAEDAVLNANYILASLKDVMTLSYDGTCMHEALFDDRFLKDTGVSVMDFAKAMIDEGYHPMTMYFPLVVQGAMLIEPTESESRAELDRFIASMRALAQAAQDKGALGKFKTAPRYAPLARLDETRAARKPVLRWKDSENNQKNADV